MKSKSNNIQQSSSLLHDTIGEDLAVIIDKGYSALIGAAGADESALDHSAHAPF